MSSAPAEGRATLPEPLATLAERIHAFSWAAHERFDHQVWSARPDARVDLDGRPESPSYHNQTHVQSVVDCARVVWSRSRELEDPFDLEGQLVGWSDRFGDFPFDWQLFGTALGIAFSCHDLGNITASPRVEIGRGGEIHLDLGERYDSSALYPRPEVEMRSADIACQLLEHHLGQGPLLEALRPLVCNLILQTVFHFDQTSSDEPFWFPMQVVDMVGSYFFAPQSRSQAVAGLFNEMRIQADGRGQVCVAGFLPSLSKRFERLLPDPRRRAAVLQMFEANRHGHDRNTIFSVPDELAGEWQPLPFADAIVLLLRG
jgi:hypothetical protein